MSDSRGRTVKEWGWPEVGRVLTAARAFPQLSPLGEDLDLLTWSSNGKQTGPEDCKDVPLAPGRMK